MGANNFYIGPADWSTSNLFGPINIHFVGLLSTSHKGGNFDSWVFMVMGILSFLKLKALNQYTLL